jgi:predicted acylesterase/phospholipase RssA
MDFQAIKCLVFAGGGIRGLAYIGALQYLRDVKCVDFGAHRPKLESLAGVSIGSLLALLICCGYSVPELISFGGEITHDDVMIPDPVRLFSGELSIDNGETLSAFIKEKLVRKGFSPDTTFSQLFACTGIKFHVTVSDTTTASVVQITPDSHPHLPVYLAVQASMSIPLIFPPVKSPEGHLWVDGGLLENFPIMRFDPSSVLGFNFRWSMEKPGTTLVTHMLRVMQIIQLPGDVAQKHLMSEAHQNRIVEIDTGDVTTLGSAIAQESVSMETRTHLMAAGSRAMRDKIYIWDNIVGITEKKQVRRELPAYLSALCTCNPKAIPHESYVTNL